MKLAISFWLFILTFPLHCVSTSSAQREAWLHLSTNSSSRTQLGDELTSEQRLALNQVADTMLDIYQLLAHMRYLDPSGIEMGLHNPEFDVEYCRQQRVSVLAMYLYQILSYINKHQAGYVGFFFDRNNSLVLDSRLQNHLLRGRGPYDPTWQKHHKRPWLQPLIMVGSLDEQAVVVYDPEEDRIRIIDGSHWHSDMPYPRLRDPSMFPLLPTSDGSLQSSLETAAPDALRTIMQWLLNLDIVPGRGSWEQIMNNIVEIGDYAATKALYEAAGWPHDFDGDAFEISLARHRARETAKEDLEMPCYVLDNEQSLFWVQQGRDLLRRLEEEVNESTSPDDIWQAKREFWEASKRQERLEQEHAKAKQDHARLCPNHDCLDPEKLLLAEVENLRIEIASAWKNDREPPGIVKHRRQILQRAFLEAEDVVKRSYPARYASAWSGDTPVQKSEAAKEAAEKRTRIKLEIDDMRRWLHRVPKTAQRIRDELVHDMTSSYAGLGEADWELQMEHSKVLKQWTDPAKRRETATCGVVWLNQP